MAGKRQHYIPKFLQRNFLAECDDEADRTWLHRRETGARLVGIKDVGVKDFFYSKYATSDEETLDDFITSIELNILGDLQTLQKTPHGSIVDSQIAARLTTHLTLRTAHLRSIFQQGTTQIIDQATELTTDSNQVRRLLGLDDLDMWLTLPAIEKEVNSSFLDELLPRPLARRLIAFSIRESFNELYKSQIPTVTEALSEVAKKIPALVRDGHNNALRSIQNNQWKTELAQLSWRIYRVSGAILPDCIALARSGSGSMTALSMKEQKKPDNIILPIASDRLLMGSLIEPIEPEIDKINAASAACSDSFFIANRSYDSTGLTNLIGQRCSLAIKEVVEEVIENAGLQDPTKSNGSSRKDFFASGGKEKKFSFSVSCQGFSEPDAVTRLGNVLKVIVKEMSRDFPLSNLDGITFAVDYETALEELDRGDPAQEADKIRPRHYGQAVAKCVNVLRHGERKEHLVISAGIAEALLTEDDQEKKFGLHIVINMLASVAYSSLYEKRLDVTAMSQLDTISRWMQKASSTCPSIYYTARISALVDPDAGERYAALLLESFSAAKAEIRSARQVYLIDQSMDKLLDAALLHVSSVLDHAAEWLGHREGLPEEEPSPGSSLAVELKAHGLDSWIELFGADLRRLHDDEGQFTFDNVVALSRHVERLLWTMGMFPWPTDEGDLYVSLGPIP